MNNLFIVDKEHEDMRLDKFVRKYSALKSLTQIFSFIRKGKIKVNNLKTKENYRLKLNDKINFDDILELKFDNYKKVESLNFKDMIVFEDEDIFIINKPNNIAMHKGNSHEYGLSEIAKNYFKNPNVNFANRLDLATQGLVIGTKNLQILRKISQEIKEKRVIKKYIAMVENKGLKIDEKFSVEKKIKITDKSVIISEDGKYAKTNFKVIDIKGTKALLDIELKTGRKHQIRLHLKSINLPIIGDIKYGKASDKMYLKCYFLKFLNYNISIDKVF